MPVVCREGPRAWSTIQDPRGGPGRGEADCERFPFGGQPLWKAFWLFFAAGFLLLSVAARQAMVAIVDPLMQEAPGEHAVALTLWGNGRCRAS